MDLKKAIEVAQAELTKANIVLVTSDYGIFLLNDKSEIATVQRYASDNKLEVFIVKGGNKSEVTEVIEDKPKKKK